LTIFKAFESLYIALTLYRQKPQLFEFFRQEARIVKDEAEARRMNETLS